MATFESRVARSYCGDLALDFHQIIQELREMDPETFEEQHGTLDRRLGQFCTRLEAIRRFLEIHREARRESLDFGVVFRQWNPSAGKVVTGIEGRKRIPVTGDSRQMLVCLELIALNACETPRDFEIRLFADAEPPGLLIRIGGEPPLASTLRFGDGLELDWRAIAGRWAAATGGGLLYEDNLGLALELSGNEGWDEGVPGFNAAEDRLRRAERAMRPWRGAIGSTEAGYAHPEEATALYLGALDRALRFLEEANEAIG